MTHRIKPIVAIILTLTLLVYCAFSIVSNAQAKATNDELAAQQYQTIVKQWGARIFPITDYIQSAQYDKATQDVIALKYDIASTTPPIQYVEFHQHYKNAAALLATAITFWKYDNVNEGIDSLEMASSELDKANRILQQINTQ
jgi:uncharacterized protein YxeA